MYRTTLIILFFIYVSGIAAKADTFTVGDLNFETTAENSCRLVASPDVSSILTVPASVTYENVEYSVSAIGSSAFADARRLEALFVPGSVTEIGADAARGCTSLRVVELGDEVTSLGAEAFAGCTALESVVLPGSLATVPRRCFYGAGALREVRIGESTATIQTQAFDGCVNLTSVVCMAPAPPATAAYAFDPDAIHRAMLTVPGGSRPAYAAEAVWRDFRSIVESDYGGETAAFTVMLPDGAVTTEEALGSRITLSVSAPDGWEIVGLYLDGEDVTSAMTPEGYYTTPAITAPMLLSIVARATASAPDTMAAPIHAKRVAGKIIVGGIAPGEAVYMHTLDGRLIYSGHGPCEIPFDKTTPVLLTAMGQKFIL